MFLGMVILHVGEAYIPPPVRYPDLYPALFSIFGAVNFVIVYFIGVCLQWLA